MTRIALNALCKPSQKAKQYGQLLRYLVIIICLITIFVFIGGNYIIGIFSIGLLFIMYYSIYDNNKYNIESTQRIVFFSVYLCIFSTIACINSISNYNNIFTWIQLFGGLIFYAITAYISNKLYIMNYD